MGACLCMCAQGNVCESLCMYVWYTVDTVKYRFIVEPMCSLHFLIVCFNKMHVYWHYFQLFYGSGSGV